MSYPTKQVREACWGSRDEYWSCLDANGFDNKECKRLRKLFEEKCPAQWVQHFDRKREYLKYKEKIEQEGYDPVDN